MNRADIGYYLLPLERITQNITRDLKTKIDFQHNCHKRNAATSHDYNFPLNGIIPVLKGVTLLICKTVKLWLKLVKEKK